MRGESIDPEGPLVEPLTRREQEVLRLLAEGYSGPEIAEQLSVALSSVRFHSQNIYGKLGVNGKRQAIARAGELGLLGDGPTVVGAAAVEPAQPGSPDPAELAPEPGESPFMGLRYFDEADAGRFFGRAALVARLVGRLAAQAAARRPIQFLAVVGASGSGKSSFVRAGVIPALKAAATRAPADQGLAFSPIHVITPTAHPLEALAASLTRGAQTTTTTQALINDLASDERALHRHLRRLLDAGDRPSAGSARSDSQVLLVVDQFEELFTLCRAEAERVAFIHNLLLAAAPDVVAPKTAAAASVLITLRADFYAACAPYAALRDALADQQAYIGRMSAAELRQAIEQPARLGRWDFAPGLVDLILRDVGDEPGALPLLSHALLETWRNRRGRTLTLKSYSEAGGVEGAIATTAEAVFQELEPEEQALARGVFLRLTELGEGTQDTRRRVTLAELLEPAQAGDAMSRVLNTLSDARLITIDHAEVQVAHEALIREWPTLRAWLTDDRDGLRLHRRLTEAAQEWQLMERDPSELYRGPRLAQALEWAQFSRRASDLNALEREFVEASRDFAEHELAERDAQRQNELAVARELAQAEARRATEQAQAATRLRGRNRVITVVGVLALLAALAAGFFGLQSSRNASVAESAGTQSAYSLSTSEAAATQAVAQRDEALRLSNLVLANQAVSVKDDNPQLALLLAAEAINTGNTDEVRSIIKPILASPHLFTYLSGHTGAVNSVAFSPDGTRLASVGVDGTLRQWDVAAGRPFDSPISTFILPQTVAYSPDGLTAAVGGPAGKLQMYDLAGQRALDILFAGLDPNKIVTDVAFSPDGRVLASAGDDNLVRLWDVASGRPQGEPLAGHTAPVTGVAFSPNGKVLASSSSDQTLRLWDTATGQPLGEPMRGHSGAARSVAFSPDGTRLASGGNDTFIFLWDLSGGPPTILSAFRGHTAAVTSVAFSPDGKTIASGSADATLRLWSIDFPEAIADPLKGHPGAVTSAAFGPNGLYLASSSVDGSVALWRVASDVIALDTQDWRELACVMAGRNLTQAEWNQYLTGQPYRKTCEQWP